MCDAQSDRLLFVFPLFPYVKAEMRDIAVLYHVILALKAQQTLFGGGGKGTAGHEIIEARDFGTDETAFDIRVDLASGFGCL